MIESSNLDCKRQRVTALPCQISSQFLILIFKVRSYLSWELLLGLYFISLLMCIIRVIYFYHLTGSKCSVATRGEFNCFEWVRSFIFLLIIFKESLAQRGLLICCWRHYHFQRKRRFFILFLRTQWDPLAFFWECCFIDGMRIWSWMLASFVIWLCWIRF